MEALEAERLANMTPEERLAEKLRQQQLEKDADLKFALGTFGVSDLPSGLDAFNPTNKEEFSEFGASLAAKISLYKSSEEYPRFVEELVRNVCVHREFLSILVVFVEFLFILFVFFSAIRRS